MSDVGRSADRAHIVLCIEENPGDAQATAGFLAAFMQGMTKHDVGGLAWQLTVDGDVVASSTNGQVKRLDWPSAD